jgi:hypothetical protein
VASWERVIVVFCLVYLVVYMAFFFAVFTAETVFENPLILPFHFFGMALSILMVILVVRDVYKRPFRDPNAKATWALLIVFGNIITIPIYLWKYGFRPRGATQGGMDVA